MNIERGAKPGDRTPRVLFLRGCYPTKYRKLTTALERVLKLLDTYLSRNALASGNSAHGLKFQ